MELAQLVDRHARAARHDDVGDLRPASAKAAPSTIDPKLCAITVSDCSGSRDSEATNSVRS